MFNGYAPVKGSKLYYEVAGNGHSLLFVHGTWVDSRMWDDQFDQFAELYQVIRYDLRGHGRSPVGDQAYSHIEDLHELLTTLEIPSATLIGHSVGGAVVMGYTLQHPERVHGLVLLDSGGVLPDTNLSDQERQAILSVVTAAAMHNPGKAIDLFTQFWVDGVNRQSAPAVRERVSAMLGDHSWPQFSPGFPGERWPDVAYLEKVEAITTPTLLVVGEQDRPGFQRAADTYASRLPRAQKATIPDAAHFSNMDQPDIVNQALLNFLQRLDRDSAR